MTASYLEMEDSSAPHVWCGTHFVVEVEIEALKGLQRREDRFRKRMEFHGWIDLAPYLLAANTFSKSSVLLRSP